MVAEISRQLTLSLRFSLWAPDFARRGRLTPMLEESTSHIVQIAKVSRILDMRRICDLTEAIWIALSKPNLSFSITCLEARISITLYSSPERDHRNLRQVENREPVCPLEERV